ncbi:MAG: hypothetical protein PVH41_05410 [Anaerolineae bacterium]|jgi:hypothetical protein
MLNPITVQMLAKTHQRDQRALWKQAEIRRICREAEGSQPPQPARPGLLERIAGRIGLLLTQVGHRLTDYRLLPG